MLRPSLLSLGVLVALAASVRADDVTLQPDVVVTASRMPQPVEATLADVSVITRADIDASAAHDLGDLLRLQAGVDIARTGGPGSQTSLFLRGTNNNHVLVLVDGIRVAALGTGVFTWETLPLDTVERIEIVRGPRASYWGSDAIGGVVQIFTRKLEGPRVSLGYGTYGDANANVGIGRRGDGGGFSVQVGKRDVDGFPSQNENGFGYEPKDHGFDNRHLVGSGDLHVGTQTLALNAVRSEGDVEFAGGESAFTQQAVVASLAGALGTRWQHRLEAGQSREDYETPVYFTAYASRRNSLGYGTYGDANANVGIGQRGDGGGFSVQVGKRDVDGFPSQNENGFGYEPKDHGFDSRHLVGSGDLRVGTQTLALNAVRSEGDVEFAGGESAFTQQAVVASLAGPLGTRWQHRLEAGQSREDYETPVYFTAYASRRNSLGWQNAFDLAEGQRLIAGIDHLRERGENIDTFGGTPVYRESRRNTGVYAGWQAAFGALDSELSLRHDDNSVFGSANTGSVALGWRFSNGLRAYASHGKAFRGPSLNEQYSPGFGGLYAGNPDLYPETSRSTEIGLEATPTEGQRFKASAYRTRVRNLISFTGIDFQAENVARARIDGGELAYDGRFGVWQASATLTWQDPRNEDTDTALLRRPKHKATARLERRFGDALRIGAEVLYAGQRDDVGGLGLPSYTLFNIRGSWQLNETWKTVARVENAGNRDYELARGYNTPGRAGYLELVWEPR